MHTWILLIKFIIIAQVHFETLKLLQNITFHIWIN